MEWVRTVQWCLTHWHGDQNCAFLLPGRNKLMIYEHDPCHFVCGCDTRTRTSSFYSSVMMVMTRPVLLPREAARDLGRKYLGTLVGRCFATGPPWQEEFCPAQHLGRKMNFSLVTLAGRSSWFLYSNWIFGLLQICGAVAVSNDPQSLKLSNVGPG